MVWKRSHARSTLERVARRASNNVEGKGLCFGGSPMYSTYILLAAYNICYLPILRGAAVKKLSTLVTQRRQRTCQFCALSYFMCVCPPGYPLVLCLGLRGQLIIDISRVPRVPLAAPPPPATAQLTQIPP